MPLSATNVYRGGQFYWWKLEYPEKTTDLPLVTDLPCPRVNNQKNK